MLAFNQEISLMEFFADSPYVAKLIGYCQEPVCLIMKYYSCGSLDNWTEKNSETARKYKFKVKICKDLASGIEVLHNRQVAHCDLKPQNVLVEDQPGQLRFLLIDFGISKILTDEYLASEAFQIRNLRGLTVPYAAPDALLRFRSKTAWSPNEEKAGDVYSFACIVFFLLTHLSPWDY
jgi:serine/threonine protein kinase